MEAFIVRKPRRSRAHSRRAAFQTRQEKTSRAAQRRSDEYLDCTLRSLGEHIPDEKIRQDAALAILAYKWGPVPLRTISLALELGPGRAGSSFSLLSEAPQLSRLRKEDCPVLTRAGSVVSAQS